MFAISFRKDKNFGVVILMMAGLVQFLCSRAKLDFALLLLVVLMELARSLELYKQNIQQVAKPPQFKGYETKKKYNFII